MLLGTESLQTFGGSGFLQDYPIEQYVRDAKIDTLYEGTTAIQGQDFFFRKIVKDQGQGARLPGRARSRVPRQPRRGNGRLKVERDLLATALEDAQAIVGAMINDLMCADASAEGGDITQHLQGRAQHLPPADGARRRGLRVAAAARCRGGAGASWPATCPAKDKAFYEGKVAAAQFFAQTNLPRS